MNDVDAKVSDIISQYNNLNIIDGQWFRFIDPDGLSNSWYAYGNWTQAKQYNNLISNEKYEIDIIIPKNLKDDEKELFVICPMNLSIELSN